ncbi:hypothetical protein ACFR9U_08970 [Halorientalis brevis]|uniref:SUKH-4 immunity protein of toxin-antitoxin system n=1 Tax=Halorientalis brevis TaxID=1126241 RepID=A0ABD6CA61_9EURY|nr:hypothetical protein [Halorientalis brevis]
MTTRSVALGHLVDEDRRCTADSVSLSTDADACERVRTYLVTAGSVRGSEATTWVFGRRAVDEQFVLVEFGARDDPAATACLLTDTGHLLFDRGGPLVANEYVAALLGGYIQFHDGEFELHAEPIGGIDALRAARDELTGTGLVDDAGEGKGPFADGLSRLATGLDDAIAETEA